MQDMAIHHIAFLILAAVLDVFANILLKYSDGFKKLGYGIGSVTLIMAAFGCLAIAVKGIELTVAYALWGGFGMIATAIVAWIMFQQRLNWRGWVGIFSLIIGMTILKFS